MHDEDQWPTAPTPIQHQPPPGKYLLSFRHGKLCERFGRSVVELEFEILEPTVWAKTSIKMYFALPTKASPSTRSKYYEHWVLANEKPPARGDRMSTRVFTGYWWANVCHTQKRADAKGCRPLAPHECGIAVVDRLIERAAGAPLKGTRP